jgi:hypothetical protein
LKRLAIAIAILIASIIACAAQSVTVIGPITPGDCTMFNSVTVVKDGGIPCQVRAERSSCRMARQRASASPLSTQERESQP